MTQFLSPVNYVELQMFPQYSHALKELIEQYGHYLYEELCLPAGKEKFHQELISFPSEVYKPPDGTFFMALKDEKLVGCVCVKKWDALSCEMKRMYVLPEARGWGVGRGLCEAVIRWSRMAGFRLILLDTNQEMEQAMRLYIRCGFKQIDPYCVNENPSPVFMEYQL